MRKLTADNIQNINLYLQEFLQVLDKTRKGEQISLGEISDVTGLSKSTLCNLFRGKTSPNLYTIFLVCHALDIKVLDALSETERAIPWNPEDIPLKEDEKKLVKTYRQLSPQLQDWLQKCSEIALTGCESEK